MHDALTDALFDGTAWPPNLKTGITHSFTGVSPVGRKWPKSSWL
jgi:hypothetical protein